MKSKNRFNIRFTMNTTRLGRCLKVWVAEGTDAVVQGGIQVDSITNEQELRRAVRAELDFISEDIVRCFLDDLRGATEHREEMRRIEAERIRLRRAMEAAGDIVIQSA